MKLSFIATSAAVVFLFLLLPLAQAAVLYEVIDLGTVAGAFRSEARGINQQGEVWGENFNSDFPYFVWKNNTNYGVAKPAEVATMALYGRNDAGQFAGNFSYSISARDISFFGPPAWPQLTVTNFAPRGLNRDAIVAGSTSVKVETFPGSGVLVLVNRPATVAGKILTRLPSLAGDNGWVDADGVAINDSGVVVGSSGTSNNVKHAFLWDGAMLDLHTLGTRSNSVAVALNNNGTVVGYMYNFLGFREPFIWTPSNGMTALTLPSGYSTGQPLGLNNRGDVVGVAGSGSAVLWTNGVMTDLQNVIATSPAWDLDGAYGINDAGEIVGYGKNGGLTKGFLLRPLNMPPAQFKIELLDPADPAVSNVFTGTGVTTDPDTLNRLSIRRSGVATDAASALVVRMSTTNSGTLTLSLRADGGATGVTGNPVMDGSISRVEGAAGFDSLGEHTVSTAQGPRAYLLYRAPEIFHRTNTSDSLRPQRIIGMQARFQPDIGAVVTQTVSIVLVRPPLIVLHGVWSDRAQSFAGFETRFQQEEPGVQIFGPSYPNSISFAGNATEIPRALGNARNAFREQNFASTRADIFAHSMGGVLSRLYAGRADYKRPENYQRGDINRLVTIDSPHRGAIFGDAIKSAFTWLDLHDLASVHAVLAIEMSLHGMPPELGAGEDLLTTSLAISNMNQRATEVAAHVIVGDFSFGVDLKTLRPEPTICYAVWYGAGCTQYRWTERYGY